MISLRFGSIVTNKIDKLSIDTQHMVFLLIIKSK